MQRLYMMMTVIQYGIMCVELSVRIPDAASETALAYNVTRHLRSSVPDGMSKKKKENEKKNDNPKKKGGRYSSALIGPR